MNHSCGMGDHSGSGRLEALMSLFDPDSKCVQMMSAHGDSDDLRSKAKWLLKARWSGDRETVAKFEIEESTGMIDVHFLDAQTGQLEFRVSPEKLMEGLKNLESTNDIDAPLSSFFVDFS